MNDMNHIENKERNISVCAGVVLRFKEISFVNIDAEFLSSTNINFSERYIGVKSRLSFKRISCFFEYRNFHTSYIVKAILQNDILTVNTRNSVYTFRILDKEFLESITKETLFELTEEEIVALEFVLSEIDRI